MKVRGIPGVTIYKPAARSGREHKYLTAYEEDGLRRVESVSTDLDFTRRYAREVSRRVELKRLGLITPAQERHVNEGKRRLPEHLADYVAVQQGRGCSSDHVKWNEGRVRRIFDACSAEYLQDLSPSRVQRAIGSMQRLNQKGEDAGPMSAQTRNHYCTALVCFFTWLKQDGRIVENPFTDKALRRFSVESDRKRVRRILSEHQLDELVRAADAGKGFQSFNNDQVIVPGWVRGDVYRVALATGLRYNEIATLMVCDLLLDEDEPTIRVSAKRAKNRHECLQHIKPSLADRLRKHMAGKLAMNRVFHLPRRRGAEMLRFDLAAAGIPYEDAEGRVFDFHALRYECGSLMVARGENLKVVQQHMRHCSITLTMDRYAKVQLHDQVAAIGRLPDFGSDSPDQQQAKATGTHGRDQAKHLPGRSAPVQRTNVSHRPGMSPDVPMAPTLKLAGDDGTCSELPTKSGEATSGTRTPNHRFTKPVLSADAAQTSDRATNESPQTSGSRSTPACAKRAQISAPGIAHAGKSKKFSKKVPGTRAATPPPTLPAPTPTNQPTNAELMEQIRLLSMQVHAMTAAKRSRREGRG